MNIDKELKIMIFNWLVDNENEWSRVNEKKKKIRDYIYNREGNYLIGGKKVSDFIYKADKLLYK